MVGASSFCGYWGVFALVMDFKEFMLTSPSELAHCAPPSSNPATYKKNTLNFFLNLANLKKKNSHFFLVFYTMLLFAHLKRVGVSLMWYFFVVFLFVFLTKGKKNLGIILPQELNFDPCSWLCLLMKP